jgi:hypothetical protein
MNGWLPDAAKQLADAGRAHTVASLLLLSTLLLFLIAGGISVIGLGSSHGCPAGPPGSNTVLAVFLLFLLRLLLCLSLPSAAPPRRPAG